jgi:CDP-diacylglycerol--serine O-phosphatidyltransferase
MAAGMVATFVIFVHEYSFAADLQKWIVLLLTFGLASLMVSTVRFPSFKELNWRSRGTFGFLMVGVLAMILVAAKPEIMLFALLSTYVVLSLAWNVVLAVKGSEQNAAVGERKPVRVSVPETTEVG